ncbi:uncharacterized protein LOC131147733 [Malania oleifera]|uniref:uncharacterized protein LOC131147733 n=1 Tax=Malania oleifera TaxID=397392 RepID=UPI0025AD9DC3|nr:uncharacterized protein LOC131147733 [Malania oleifera]
MGISDKEGEQNGERLKEPSKNFNDDAFEKREHQFMPSAYDIMQNLKEKFRDQNCAARQTAMKELMNTTIAQGTPIRHHVLKMISLLNEPEILRAEIDGIPDELDTELGNYCEALQDKEVEFWQKAMKSEMESIYTNQVWDLVEPPKGIKPIGCKWISKKKRGANKRMENFKARLFTKRFT